MSCWARIIRASKHCTSRSQIHETFFSISTMQKKNHNFFIWKSAKGKEREWNTKISNFSAGERNFFHLEEFAVSVRCRLDTVKTYLFFVVFTAVIFRRNWPEDSITSSHGAQHKTLPSFLVAKRFRVYSHTTFMSISCKVQLHQSALNKYVLQRESVSSLDSGKYDGT